MLSNIIRYQRKISLRTIMTTAIARGGPVSQAIERKLTEAFSPTYLEIRNESHMHNVPKDSETHFKVIVISDKFNTAKTPISRHRLVNATLKEEVATDGPIHALSIVAYTPEKWQEKIDKEGGIEGIVGPSPNCRGGDGSLPPKK